jgi:hypothetical protein
MNVGELKEVLERIHELYELAGATGPASDFGKLIATLSGHEHETVDSYVEETKRLLKIQPEEAPVRRREAVNDSLVERYGRKLLEAGTSRTAFEAALARIQSATEVTVADLSAIARRYINEPTGGDFEFQFKSKQDAYRHIRRMFNQRAQDENKAEIIKRMTG